MAKGMRGAKVSIVVVLFLLASAPFNPSATLLDAEHTPSRAPAVAMSLDVSRTTITADQALLVSADLRDAAGQPVQGAVNWSVSNGSIEATGLFVPWSAGSVQITGEHGDCRPRPTSPWSRDGPSALPWTSAVRRCPVVRFA